MAHRKRRRDGGFRLAAHAGRWERALESSLADSVKQQRMREADHRTDEDLVKLCREGEREAFDELVRRRKGEILRFVARFCNSLNEADDLGQQTFLKAYQGLGSFRAASSFRTWLFRIASNVCRDHLRKRARGSFVPLNEDMAGEADGSMRRQEQRVLVNTLLRSLSPMDRIIVTMLHVEGFTVEQTAERVGVTGVTVRVRAHRARKRLKSLMEERHDRKS